MPEALAGPLIAYLIGIPLFVILLGCFDRWGRDYWRNFGSVVVLALFWPFIILFGLTMAVLGPK